MSAHGEALELYRWVVRNLPAGAAALDRAALFNRRWETKPPPPMTTQQPRRKHTGPPTS